MLSLSLFSLFVCELLPLSVCAVLSSIGCAPSAQSNCVIIGERVPLLLTNDLAQVSTEDYLATSDSAALCGVQGLDRQQGIAREQSTNGCSNDAGDRDSYCVRRIRGTIGPNTSTGFGAQLSHVEELATVRVGAIWQQFSGDVCRGEEANLISEEKVCGKSLDCRIRRSNVVPSVQTDQRFVSCKFTVRVNWNARDWATIVA